MGAVILMQIGAIYRRGIVLPKTQDAIQRLVANDIESGSDMESIRVPDTLFSKLWGSRFFSDLNRECGTIFSDYEEDFLPVDRVTDARRVLRHRLATEVDSESLEFYRALHALFERAEGTGYPLLFVL